MPTASGKKNNFIKEQLSLLADPAYRDFSSSLLPGTDHILGVRLPALRKLAKKLAKENWAENLSLCTGDSFEEIMLQGFLIGYAKAPLHEILEQTAAFIPKIDNWSVCDSFCITMKVAKQYPEAFWDFLQTCLESSGEFIVRFAVVMLLDYFITGEYIDRIYPVLDRIKHQGYYVKMAVAWAASMCYAAFPDETLPWLQAARLDEFTYRRTIRKICESHQVNAEQKSHLRALERRRQG